VELVEGLSMSLPAHIIPVAISDSQTASLLVQKLMSIIFRDGHMFSEVEAWETFP
jgi:hypothetical protein